MACVPFARRPSTAQSPGSPRKRDSSPHPHKRMVPAIDHPPLSSLSPLPAPRSHLTVPSFPAPPTTAFNLGSSLLPSAHPLTTHRAQRQAETGHTEGRDSLRPAQQGLQTGGGRAAPRPWRRGNNEKATPGEEADRRGASLHLGGCGERTHGGQGQHPGRGPPPRSSGEGRTEESQESLPPQPPLRSGELKRWGEEGRAEGQGLPLLSSRGGLRNEQRRARAQERLRERGSRGQ